MKHPHIRTGRSLAGMILILFGLSAYGCGDSATVNPVVELSSLSVTTGTTTAALQPRFSRETTDYTVQLSNGVTSVTVSARAAVDGDSVSINGQPTTNRTIALEPAGQTTVVNVVVSESNTNSRTYTVKLVRAGLGGNNSLRNLSVSPGKLNPVFTADEQFYRVDEINSTNNTVTVTPTLDDPDATMTVDGQDTASDQGREIALKPAGQITTIEIFVKAHNGQVKQYHVEVPRGTSGNNDLSALTVRLSTSSPNLISFSLNTTTYTVDVGNGVASIRVTPTLDDPTATLTVTSNGPGPITTSGQTRTIPLRDAGLSTTITIRVAAQNGNPKIYTVDVDRAALAGNNNLSALTVRLSTSSPNLINFSLNTTTYTVDVGSGVSTITVTPSLQDPAATLTVTSNGPGPITTSGQARTIPLRAAGLSTTINIAVRAPNGSEKPYTITVDRATPPPPSGNNNLSALTVRLSTSSPNLINFSLNTTTYTVDVGSGVSTITVTPSLQDPAATLTVTSNGPGPITTSGQARTIPLRAAGLSTTINIVVRAPNGSEKPYTITVDRATPPPPSGNNNLQNLTTSPGTLTPLFDVNRIETGYAVNDVSSSATSILVTATPQDSSATVEINKQAGNSRSIPLPTGPSTTDIEVLVRAPNSSEKIYSITVNQPAPAAPPAPPANAPDLLTADDSCPLKPLSVGNETFTNDDCAIPEPTPEDPNPAPFGTRDDNKTNVKKPRFTIPQPTAGTPSLYVGTHKDTFAPGATTLTPSIDLSVGNNTITYTLTNAGGESDPSPSLNVIFDASAP